MRSFTKTILAAVLFAVSSGMASAAPTLNVRIQNNSGVGVGSVTVAAIEFGMNGPSTYTLLGLTNSGGNVLFTLSSGTYGRSYNLYYSSHGFSPSISDQFNNPEYDPNRYVWAQGDNVYYSTFTVAKDLTQVGRLKLEFTNATPNKVLFGGVYNMKSQMQGGSGIVMADVSGNGTLAVDNVPYTTESNTYNIGLYDPEKNLGIGRNVMALLDDTAPLEDGARTIAYTGGNKSDFNDSVPPKRVEDNTSASGGNTGAASSNVSVEGVVRSTETIGWTPIGWQGVNFSYCGGYGRENIWAQVDENGGFQLRGLKAGVTYYAEANGGCTWTQQGPGACYEPSRSPGFDSSLSQNQDFCDSNPNSMGPNDFLYVSTTNVQYVAIKLNKVPKSIGEIKVYVKAGGFSLRSANVNISPDHTAWSTNSCVGMQDWNTKKSNPGFANANVQVSSMDYAMLDGLPSGNYMINVWTPFSNTGHSALNSGTDGKFAWDWQSGHCTGDGADDYRITIDTMTTPSLKIYNKLGNQVSGVLGGGIDVGLSSITVTVQAGGGSPTGLVKGTIKFSQPADLTNDPLMITLSPNCDGGNCQDNPPGNFAISTGAAVSHNFEIPLSTGFSYWMDVRVKNWGRVRTEDGNNNISLKSTGTVVYNMNFVPGGTIKGTVYKPDGTVLTPGNNEWVSVNADSDKGWSWSQLEKDGTFAITQALPGENRLNIHISRPNGQSQSTYSMPWPAPKVNVIAGAVATANVNLVASNYVGIKLSTGMLPDATVITSTGTHKSTILGFRVVTLPAGTVLKGETITSMFFGDGDWDQRFNYSVATSTSDNQTQCGPGWPGGFCGIRMPSPSKHDFYLMRNGDFGDMKDGGPVDNAPMPHFVLLTSSKNVVVDDAHATAMVRPRTYESSVPVSGVEVNLTPPTDMSGRGNASLGGQVTAANFFRQADYDACAGDFEKFTQFLPMITLYDANSAFKAAGIVVPPMQWIAQNEAQFDLTFAQGYTQFKNFLDTAPNFAYEIRGLEPSACYTAVATTPNYPSYQKRVCVGANGSIATLNVNLDSAVGAGATVAGVVTSTNTAVRFANATVELFGEGFAKTAVTDSTGAYKFEGLPAGTVKLKASLDGHASVHAEKDLVGSNGYTQDFALTAAGGSISGTVYSQKLPYAKVQAGAEVVAFNDTYNGLNPDKPVPLIKTQTGADGAYKLTGLIPGDVYKVFLKVPGKYTLSVATPATSGDISGIDFIMKPKPMDLEIFAKKTASAYEFKVLNPADYKEGSFRWSPKPYSEADSMLLGMDKLSTGERGGKVPLALLTPGITFVLRASATSYANKNVIRELEFSKDLLGNADQKIDSAILGDETTDANGRKNNEIPLDPSGDNPSAIVFPPGSVQSVSSAAVPTCSFKGESRNSSAVADKVAALGADAFAGDLYTLSLSSVAINTGKSIELTLAYDKSGSDLDDLAVARYNDTTGKWDTVTGVATVDPLKGTVKVKLKSLASVLDVKKGRVSVASFDGRQYVVRPLAGGSSSSAGTFAAVKPSLAGNNFTGTRMKVFNYPNPFNLKDKAISNNNGAALPGTVNGTVIHVEVPAGNGGPGHVRIYTLAGELVKDIKVDFEGGKYNYVGWDGHNSGGQEVANGVYYGVVEMSGKSVKLKDATFKMAVIK